MKNKKEKKIALKLFLCLIYVIIMTVLLVVSYKMIQDQVTIKPWGEVETIEDYSYMDIYKMSEKFAYYEESNIGIHFIIEKEDTGLWHTYLIAINESDYEKYKAIIDYTYKRTEETPKPIRVYGYPVLVDDSLKQLAIKNIPNFVPKENEIKITNENYETYLTNSYLDTTQEKKEEVNILLLGSLMLLVVVFLLLILTIFDKTDKVVRKVKRTRRWKNDISRDNRKRI